MYLKEEFKKYLEEIQQLSNDSIKSYFSIEKHLNVFLGDISFKKLVENHDLDTPSYIELPTYNEKIKLSKGTFENINTYLNRYKEFLIYQIEQNLAEKEVLLEHNNTEIYDEKEEIIQQKVPAIILQNQGKIYHKKDIERIFFFRLITQNRFNSSGLYFPISFLKQYFYKTGDKEYFDTQIYEQIGEINVFISKSEKPVKLKTLRMLEIKNGLAYFNGYSILSKNFQTNELKKIEVPELKYIAIDHIKSISNILKDNSKNEKDFSQLLFISKQLKKYLNTPITYKKLIAKGTKLSNDKEFIKQINKEQLKREIEYLMKATELQLMCSKDNNKKRDK